MFEEIANYLINIISSLFGAALLLRAWAQAVRLSPNNPYSQAVFQATNWLVLPLRRILPGFAGVDWACIAGAWLTAALALVLTVLIQGVSPLVVLPLGLIVAVLTVLKWALNLLLWLTVLLGVLSWVNPRSESMWPLHQLTAPVLNPIRRRLPATGGIDFSLLVLIVLIEIALMVLGRVGLELYGF
jgi:YggT family protein